MRKPYYYTDRPAEIVVPAERLDELLGGSTFDLIVMDIEGSEYFALKGMPQILSRSGALMIEFIPHHLRNVGAVSVEEFVSTIAERFDTLTIPSKNLVVGRQDFVATLQAMYSASEVDDVIFEKRTEG